MNEFQKYYVSQFKNDLNKFFSLIPNESKFHDDIEKKETYSIQIDKLKPQSGYLDFLSTNDKEYFILSLYFIILFDMVCYSTFKSDYEKFRQNTKYPKFIGNCLSQCHFHLHPKNLLSTAFGNEYNTESLKNIFKGSENFMKDQIFNLFDSQNITIDKNLFWIKCKNESPLKF
jgi:hypothetical protein